jgi:hypothetical protein
MPHIKVCSREFKMTRRFKSFKMGVKRRRYVLQFELFEPRCVLAAPTIALLPAEDIGLRSATIGVELIDTGGTDPNLTLYWGDEDGGMDGRAWDNSAGFGQVVAGRYTKVLDNLGVNVPYYYRAFALSFSGGFTWSDVGSFRTLPPGLASIEVDPIKLVSGTTADVSGRVTDTGGDIPVVTVYLGDRMGGDDPSSWQESREIGPVEGAFSSRLTGLRINTNYYVRVAARNAGGVTWAGPPVQIQTADIPPLRISEFMAANSSVATTRVRMDTTARFQNDRNAFDWIEIQNASAEARDISGYHLTDSRDEPTKWAFPAGTTIAAGGTIVVYASEFDLNDPIHDENGRLHTNFAISRDGEYLAIADAQGKVLHEIDDFPPQNHDASYGYFGNFLGQFRAPTPGEINGPLGPSIQQVDHKWEGNDPAKSWTVVANVSPSMANLKSVDLHYRVMFGDVLTVPMNDDGIAPDKLAGDGQYAGVIPGGIAKPGEMLRYYVTATDEFALEGRAPIFSNPTGSAEYLGTMIPDPNVISTLPVLYRFVEDVRRADRDAGTRVSLYYDGEFYDNAFIRIRGGTARSWPKKSYKIEFNDDHHFRFRNDVPRVDEIDVNATYTDKSYVRAVMTAEFQLDAGTPAPESFLIRMHENGAFHSVGIFVEQPDRDFLRRHGMDPDGAFYKGGPGSTYAGSVGSFEKKNRDFEDKSDVQALLQGLRLQGDELEHFLFDNVNLPAQINYMATTIITQNIDGSDKNHYLYRDTNGTGEWHMMPWDLDLTFGPDALNTNVIVSDEVTRGASNPNAVHPFLGGRQFPLHAGKTNDLLDRLIKNPRTQQMLLRRIRTLADQYLGTTYFQDRIDQIVAQIEDQVVEDRAKWRNNAHFPGRTLSLRDETDRIKNEYLARRYPYLTRYHVEGGVGIPQAQPPKVPIEFGEMIEYNPANGKRAEEYFLLHNPNSFAVDVSGWSIRGATSTTLAAGTVIPAGDQLYLAADVRQFRARQTGPSGNQGLFVQGYDHELPNDGGELVLYDDLGNQIASKTYGSSIQPANSTNLRVTELNFNPFPGMPSHGELPAGSSDFEFIEFENVSDVPIELSGVKVLGGIDFTFASQQLAPHARTVVVGNRTAFESRYGATIPIAVGGTGFEEGFAGNLSDGGEAITVVDPNGSAIQQFEYRDSRAWPDEADGAGGTMEVLDINGDYSQGMNWIGSQAIHGTPGRQSSPAIRDIVINEIMSRSQVPAVDKIELVNTTNTPIDIGGWFISDSTADLFKFQIPAGTRLGPHEYLVLDENQLGFGFKGSDEDDAWLVAVNSAGRLERFADHVKFPASLTDLSRGRWPNSLGPLVLMQSQSFGSENRSPYGDFDHDQAIDDRDINALCTQIRSAAPDARFDLNGDLKVAHDDLFFLVHAVMQTDLGDANLDRRFDSRDLIAVLQSGQYEDSVAGNSTWSEGDWNCDGDFTSRDVVAAFQEDRYLLAAVAPDSPAETDLAALILSDRQSAIGTFQKGRSGSKSEGTVPRIVPSAKIQDRQQALPNIDASPMRSAFADGRVLSGRLRPDAVDAILEAGHWPDLTGVESHDESSLRRASHW